MAVVAAPGSLSLIHDRLFNTMTANNTLTMESRMDAETISRFIDGLRPAFEADDDSYGNKAAESACVKVIEDQYRAMARGDLDGFLGFLSDDIALEIVGPEVLPIVGRWQGRDVVAEAVQKNFSWITDQKPELISVIAQGDVVVVSAREQGKIRATGRSYEVNWVQIYTVRHGKIARVRQIFDSAPMVEACVLPT